MRTILTVTLEASGRQWTQELLTMPPLGDASVLAMLVSMAMYSLESESIEAVEWLALGYEFTNDGDPPVRAVKRMQYHEVVLASRGRPIHPLEPRTYIQSGRYRGWVMCQDGWMMPPDETGE